MAEPGTPAAWQMSPDQERQDRLTRGGKFAMPQPPPKKPMTRQQDQNVTNPDAPGIIDSMHHALEGSYEDI